MIKKLPTVRGQYRENYPLAPLTWFKVGGMAEVLFKPLDAEDLSYFLANKPANLDITILGAGSNVIVRDGGVDGVVIRLGRSFTDITILSDNRLKIGAGALNYNVAQFCLQNGIKGFEFLIGIPGTVGGGVAMNAGAYGTEYKDIVAYIEAVDYSGNLRNISNFDAGFLYRANSLPKDLIFTGIACKYELGDSIAIKACMDEIITSREASQPVKEKTGGSTFANPPGHKAWELIDKVGMRGFKVGGAMFSEKHCNFMINCGNATAADLEALGEKAMVKVLQQCDVELKWEIKRMGKN